MKSNKQPIFAVGILAVLVLLTAAVLRFGPVTIRHPLTEITLSDRATGALAEIQLKNTSGSYTITRDATGYLCPQLQQLPTSYDAFEAFAQRCAGITATSGIHLPEDEAALGFDHPRAVLQVTFSDAATLTLTIGAAAEEYDGYYARLAEDGPVYLLATADATPFFADASAFVDLTLAEPAADLPDFITLTDADGALSISRLPQPVTDALGESYSYELTDPTRSAYADDANMATFFSGLSGLTARGVVQLYPSLEELQSYGILNEAGLPARTLRFAAGDSETELRLGNRSGDFYYVCKDGVDAVFSLPLTEVCWDGVSFFRLMAARPLAPAPQEVAQIVAETAYGSYTIDIDEGGSTASVNGEPLSDRTFGLLYRLLFSFEGQYELEDKVENILPELILTVTYRTPPDAGAGRVDTVRFVPYGIRRHAIELNGAAFYAVRSGYVTLVADTLLNLRDGAEINTAW